MSRNCLVFSALAPEEIYRSTSTVSGVLRVGSCPYTLHTGKQLILLPANRGMPQ
jgi:hypothetical protein